MPIFPVMAYKEDKDTLSRLCCAWMRFAFVPKFLYSLLLQNGQLQCLQNILELKFTCFFVETLN